MATDSRSLLLEAGYFLDAQVDNTWKAVYIFSYLPSEGQVTVLVPTANSEGIASVDLAVADCRPVFQRSSESVYVRNEYLKKIGKFMTSGEVIERISDAKMLADSGSEEHFIQLYRCLIPRCAFIPIGDDAIIELKILEIAMNMASEFLVKVIESLISTLEIAFAGQIASIWNDFTTYIPRLIVNFASSKTAQQSLQIIENSHYFEQICLLINQENCPIDWMLSLAGISFIWLTHRKDLRVELLAGYKLHTKANNLEAWGAAGSVQVKNLSFPFLKPLEQIFTHDKETFVSFYQELILTCLQSSNLVVQLSAIRLLRDAVVGGVPYGVSTFHKPEIRVRLALISVNSEALTEMSEMFTRLIGKGDLKSFLEECGPATSSFNQPAIVFPVVEKKDWPALQVMVSNGLRLSAFAGNPEAVNLIIYCAVGRTIPVHIFHTLVDIEVHPQIEVYYLVLRRYAKGDQMSMLMAMAPSHSQVKDKVSSLPRGAEEVGEMLLQFEFFHPRVQGIWVLERLGLTRKLPRGLIRSVVLEFGYPIKWAA
jgi:hypothetical protein